MTQTASALNKKFTGIPLHFGVCLWKRNTKFAVLSLVMSMLGLPLVLLYLITSISAADYQFEAMENLGAYVTIAVICTIVGTLSGTIAATESFRHLFDKQTVDMELSLPLSAKQRFFSGYLSGLGVYLLPFILSQIVSLILLLIGNVFVDGKTLPFYSTNGDNDIWVCDVFENITSFCIRLIVGGTVLMLVFYTLWVLTMTFCGSKTEVWLYGAGANFCLPALYLALIILCANGDSAFYGFDSDAMLAENSPANKIFAATSPIGLGYSLAMSIAYFIDGRDISSVSIFSVESFVGFIIKGLILTAVFLTAAYFIYKRRRAEDTGKSFVIKGFYYFVLVCMEILLLSALYTIDAGIIPTIIISGLAYIILDCISNRGVKKLGFSVLKYAATAGAIAIVFAVVKGTGMFGAIYRVPAPSEVSSVSLEGNFKFGNTEQYFNDDDLVFSDTESIKIITNAHRLHLDRYKSGKSSSGKLLRNIKIKYRLKSGGEMIRIYNVDRKAYQILNELNIFSKVKENMLKELKEYTDKCIESDTTTYVRYYKYADDLYKENGYFYSRFTDDELKELVGCYEEDIKALTLGEYQKYGIDYVSKGTIVIYNYKSSGSSDTYYLDLYPYLPLTLEYLMGKPMSET